MLFTTSKDKIIRGNIVILIRVNGERGIILNLIQFFVSFVLYFVIFFGLAFILNMLLRTTWLMTLLYPIIILLVISGNGIVDYFIDTKEAFLQIQTTINTITLDDYIILSGGLIGTIVSAIVIRLLRRSGYQMF